MSAYDLTPKIAKYLDIHLFISMTDFLLQNKDQDANELKKSFLDLLKITDMVDSYIHNFCDLYPDTDVPAECLERKKEIIQNLNSLKDKTQELFEKTDNDEVKELIETCKDQVTLFNKVNTEYGVSEEMLRDLYRLSKNYYECGIYHKSNEFINIYMLLAHEGLENYASVMWGNVSSNILLENWDNALDAIIKLKEFIDSPASCTQSKLLTDRSQLIHWSLFVFSSHPNGTDIFIEMFLKQEAYLNAIQTVCPHILRYLCVAVMINWKRKSFIHELVKVIKQESYAYSDPITSFIEFLLVDNNLNKAHQQLKICEEVFSKDFFIYRYLPHFLENAKELYFEMFCRIHQCINISTIAEKLEMSKEGAEIWIANLIRCANLNAKIDSRKGHIVMGVETISPYQKLIDKCKSITFKSQILVSHLEKKVYSQTNKRTW